MPILDKLSKNRSAPLAIIFKGADILGIELTKLLIDQGAFVIIIDEYNQKNKNRMGELLEHKLFSFIDISGVESLAQSIDKLDYIFYFNHERYDPDEDVSTSEFLEKSNKLDRILELGVDMNSKFLLTSSIQLHKELQSKKDLSSNFEFDESLNYTVLEVQRYAENLTWEYYKKGGLDARILRVGEVLGERIDIERKTILVDYIKKAIKGGKIEVEGDGLEGLYFVHAMDAAYGLIKAQFTEKTSGNVYSLVIPRDITVLNLAYKILDLEPRASGIEFISEKKKEDLELYKPAKNLKAIGWKPKISFERGLAQTIDYFYKIYGKRRKSKKRDLDKTFEENVIKDIQKEKKKRRSIKDSIMNFFFEVKDVEKPRSVLDNIQYKSQTKHVLDNGKDKKGRVHLTTHRHNFDRPKRSKLKVIGWKIVDLFQMIKNYVRSLTIKRILLFTSLFIFLAFLYLFLIVPFIRICYFSKVVYDNTRQANEDIELYEFTDASMHLEKAYKALESIDNNFQNLSYLRNLRFLTFIEEYHQKTLKSSDITYGLFIISDSLSSIENYFDIYESNVIIEGEDHLKVTNAKDYDLDQVSNLKMDINRGFQMTNDLSVFDESDYRTNYIGNYLKLYQESLNQMNLDFTSFSDSSEVIPTLLAVKEPQTYAVLLVNEDKPTSRGGEVEAVCIFDIFEGNVTKIAVYDSSEINISLSEDEERIVRDELKLLYPSNGLKFSEITLIFDETDFSQLVKSEIKDLYGKSPHHLISVNKSAISDLLGYIGGFDMNEIGNVNSMNIREKVDEDDFSSKEFLAKVFTYVFSYHIEDMATFKIFLDKNISENNFVFYTDDENFKSYFYEGLYIYDKNTNIDDEFRSYFSGEGVVPDVDIESYIQIDQEDPYFQYKINLTAGYEAYEGILIVYLGNNAIIDELIPSSSKVSLASSYGNKIFINVNVSKGDSDSIIIKGISGGIDKNGENMYNYYLYYEKPYGFSFTYDITLDYGNYLELNSSPSISKNVDTAAKLEGNLEKNTLWNFEFTPKE